MTRNFLCLLVMALWSMRAEGVQQSAAPAVAHHEANFDAERRQADELFTAHKYLEALPLYEDLCRQDGTIAVFAERHGTGLMMKSSTLADPAERTKVFEQALAEIRRAKALGDDSAYVQVVLGAGAKSPIGAVLSGIALTPGYTYQGTQVAHVTFQRAEATFARGDYAGAVALYVQAASLDPAWYTPALDAGDMYFRMKDVTNAGVWFAKAVAIDPDRETAYRYWGDALFQGGDREGARAKFVEAVVAEPYANALMLGLKQWAQKTGHQVGFPAIMRPEFATPGGVLKIDPELAASTQDGRSSWIVYEQYRVAHGARTLNQPIVAGGSDANGVKTPSGYLHTIAEEHAALRAMLADLNDRLRAGALTESSLDPSLRNIRNLEKANMLGAWVAINAADTGIRSDYPEYRSHHRQHLVDYVNTILIR